MATSRGIALIGHGKRQNAALESIRGEVGHRAALGALSSTHDELTVLTAQIGRHPAIGLADLVIKFDALMWLLLDDGAAADREAERRVRWFGREIRNLTISDRK